MKVAALLDKRQQSWRELERLCAHMETRSAQSIGAEAVARFGALYRSACADLALADAYQLPPGTVNYLHHLVGRAHNQLYRSRSFRFGTWFHAMFVTAPRQILRDNCFRLAIVLFGGVFLAAMGLAYSSPAFTEQVVGKDMMIAMEDMYSEPLTGRGANADIAMTGFYGQHNTSIGLRCYAMGFVLGFLGLFELVYNASVLGAVFGHMLAGEHARNFREFVTAHGPFELTAIVLSAAAGMRVGFSFIFTRGLARTDSLRKAAFESLPTIAAAAALFGGAALIEGFVSPSPLPYWVKATVAGTSGGLMFFYFVVLGWPRGDEHAA
jgi:uncharacterized membrane protein SpoIIM required for sporulation